MASPDSEPIFAEGFLALGLSHMEAGRLDKAETALRRAVILLPAFADAASALGRLFRQRNDPEAAIRLHRRALALCPGSAPARHTLAVAYLELGHNADAIGLLSAVVRDQPDDVDAVCNLGTALLAEKRGDEAARAYRRSLSLAPGHATALFNLGTIRQEERGEAEAAGLYHRALRADPAFTLAWFNLGTAYERLGQLDDAVAAYTMVTERQPDNADAAYNLGILYQGRGMLDEAAQAYGTAVRRSPAHTDARFSLGTVRQEQRRLDEAMDHYRNALNQAPDHIAARINLGTALYDRGHVAEANTAYEEAVKRGPMAEAHWNLALVRLLQGDLRTGWEEYEWRRRTKDFKKDTPILSSPQWAGEPGDGRTILLYAEQGLGDTIQFCRYAPLVAARGWRVVLDVQAPLCRLLEGAFDGVRIIAQGSEPPPHDVHCPLMSLPYVFGTTLETIPAQVPYLPATTAGREERLGPGPRVGLVWAGNPAHRNDAGRSIPAASLRGLLETPGIRFFSLQKEPRPGDRALIASWNTGFTDLGPEIGDFVDTAEILAALDLVIVVDTSVAHLAGALGRPTWVLIPPVPDWRWLMDREDSPWYPTARLFRQNPEESWDDVLIRVAKALVLWRNERTIEKYGLVQPGGLR